MTKSATTKSSMHSVATLKERLYGTTRSKSKTPAPMAPWQGERRPYVTITGRAATATDMIDHDESYFKVFQLMVAQARSNAPCAIIRAVPCNFDKKQARRDYTLLHKVDLVDIYRYYKRHPTLAGKVSTRSFGEVIGLPISKSSIARWLKDYENLKEAAMSSPEGAKLRVHRKNTTIDKALCL